MIKSVEYTLNDIQVYWRKQMDISINATLWYVNIKQSF